MEPLESFEIKDFAVY